MRALLVVVLLSGCAGAPPRATRGGKVLDIWSGISTKEFIRVRGMGTVPGQTVGQVARRGASRNSALVGARYQLLALVQGVKLEGGITLSQLMEQDSLIKEIANEIVAGGEEVLVEWLPDDGCVVTLELQRARVERLIQQKSEREKGLEQRVDRLTKRLMLTEGSLVKSRTGWARWDRHEKAEWRKMRAAAMWGGHERWPFTWFAGAGDWDCRNPISLCYWSRTRPGAGNDYSNFPDEDTKRLLDWTESQKPKVDSRISDAKATEISSKPHRGE